MGTLNHILTALFDVILAPFGYGFPWFDLVFWPVVGGILALVVIKLVSNQAGITRAKNFIQVHLLEVVLFRDDLRVVLPATVKSLSYNMLYLGYNLVPMLVMFVPMTAILVQLVSTYAYAPLPVGDSTLITVEVDPASQVPVADVTLELPPGLSLEAPPVRTTDGEIAWRLHLDAPGDYTLRIHAGGVVEEKSLAVGGEARKVSVLRTRSWEALLYPAEDVPAADSPIREISVTHRVDRALPGLPDGESGILGWFFGVSLLAGFLLKDLFGVTL